jgi:cobaltochelatase CobS
LIDRICSDETLSSNVIAWLQNNPSGLKAKTETETIIPTIQTPIITENTPMTQNNPGSEATQLAAVLQSILTRPVGIDAEAVRTIVAEALKNVDLTPSVTINFPDRETIVLEEITHKLFPKLLRKLQIRKHTIIVGGAGAGKTHATEQAARALGLTFYPMTAATFSHELVGYRDATREYARTPFREGYEHGGIVLIDEADASSADCLLVLNAMLANGFGAFPDGRVKAHPDFICVLCTNTDGSGATMQYSGRARLDGAFLDRFMVQKWEVDPAIEKASARGNIEWLAAVRAVRAYAEQHQILDVVATPRAVANGAALLAAGEDDREEVLMATLYRGALTQQWPSVLALGPVADFLAGF